MKFPSFPLLSAAAAALLVACGEDRSDEQPFAPTVETVAAEVTGDSARLTGAVIASPNSSLTECGFTYGNDTLTLEVVSPDTAFAFSAVTDSLGAGDYYAVAYATNGMGTSHGDTLRFTIGQE